MRLLSVLLLLSLIACSTRPTSYQPIKDKQGYSDKNMDNLLRMTTFQGNSATSKKTAELYAKFRAIEICHKVNRPLAHIMLVKDNSYSEEISQTTSTGPTYSYGMSPYYGVYGGAGPGWGMGYGTTTTTTSNDTYNYPMFDVYFECVDKAMDARVSLINLSASQMSELVKDVQGAVQVDAVLDDSPNKGRIQKGDIIIRVNGERVEKIIDVYHAFRKPSVNTFQLEFFRDGVRKTTMASFADVTKQVEESQREIIKEACRNGDMKSTNKLCK